MDEETLSKTPPALLRLTHAEYFREEYVRHSGPPMDSYWLMVGYFDAFLFSLAPVQNMASPTVRDKLDGIPAFRFFKALRNVTTHHSVLAASVSGNKFPRPFSRHVRVAMDGPPSDSSRLIFRLDVLRQILDAVAKERRSEKNNVEIAKSYINELEARQGDVFLEDIMSEALTAVKSVVSKRPTSKSSGRRERHRSLKRSADAIKRC